VPDPQTSNILLNVPQRGSDTGTWDIPLNSNSTALDGYQAGFQTISVSNAPITLTSPAGTPTPSGGPTQAQNAVLRFTGALTANVQITLPLPGYYIVENLTTNSGGIFLLQFRAAGTGEVICIAQGKVQHIYNDGTNVRFVNLPEVGEVKIWAGFTSMPAWVTNCTKRPYLLCDGTVYNGSDYPYLGTILGSAFGGNGSTTFAVPDLRGRVPLPTDSGLGRITAAVSGINGAAIGSAADNQGVTLTVNQIPAHTHSNSLSDPGHSHGQNGNTAYFNSGGSFGITGSSAQLVNAANQTTNNAFTGITINNASQGGGAVHTNVQPSLITGIAVIRAA
jgi:microcystin-dependent protein